jgi:hypothetical protein
MPGGEHLSVRPMPHCTSSKMRRMLRQRDSAARRSRSGTTYLCFAPHRPTNAGHPFADVALKDDVLDLSDRLP